MWMHASAHEADRWIEAKHGGTDANQVKRAFILDQLALAGPTHLADCDIQTFNAFFGATPRPSVTYIQSPATWSIGRFGSTLTDNEDFLKVCKFKWAFRVKPDLVIQPSPDQALCIEAKWASGEGRYPSVGSEVQEFAKRGLKPLLQTTVQEYMMTDLVGLECEFMFLVREAGVGSLAHTTVTWKEAFASLDPAGFPSFITDWVDHVVTE